MPDAELRRQQRARRKGILQATALIWDDSFYYGNADDLRLPADGDCQ